MSALIWNNDKRCYTAHVNNDLVEIDGDVFAETEQEMRAQYIEDGLSKEEAEKKAWNELNSAERWYQEDLTGVTITKVKNA